MFMVRKQKYPSLNFLPKKQSIFASGEFINLGGILYHLGWDGPQVEKLWRYNQHYFDDLNAVRSHRRKKMAFELIINWISNNPVGLGVGWEPYPTSLRIVNWIKWASKNSELPEGFNVSLSLQAEWLSKGVNITFLAIIYSQMRKL